MVLGLAAAWGRSQHLGRGWFSLLPPGLSVNRFTHLNRWVTGRLYFAC